MIWKREDASSNPAHDNKFFVHLCSITFKMIDTP